MGSCSRLYVGKPYASGIARVTRCPKDQVTTWPFPEKQPSSLCVAPTMRAISRATEGFSAMTSFKEYASGSVKPKDAILYKKLFVTAVINEYREVELT